MIWRQTCIISVIGSLSLVIMTYLHQNSKNIFLRTRYATFQEMLELTNLHQNAFRQQTEYERQHIQTELKILVWNPFLSSKENHWKRIFKRITSNQCPDNRCKLLYDKKQHLDADAVLFSDSFMNHKSNYKVPTVHPQNQLWIMYGMEANHMMAPKVKKGKILKMSRLGMNWTMHFRLDSDIVSPYGAFRKIEQTDDTLVNNNTDIWSTKNRDNLVAWMVSNCRASSKRDTYTEELKLHINVDIFGGCSKLKCGEVHGVTRRNYKIEECNKLIKRYFFYLAFENAFCKDYASEKLFRGPSLDTIPIVMGGADYKRIAPPHSYINILDFQTPKHLAHYLKKVAADPVLYNKYFEWKSHYVLDIGYPYTPLVCGLCEKLHQHRSESHPIPTELNLVKWFAKDECQGCSWKDVMNNISHCQYFNDIPR